MAINDYMNVLNQFGYGDVGSAVTAAKQKYGYAPTVPDQEIVDMLERQARSYQLSGGSPDYKGFFSTAPVNTSTTQATMQAAMGGGSQAPAPVNQGQFVSGPVAQPQQFPQTTKSFGQLPAQPAQVAPFTTGQTAPIPVGQPTQQTNPYMSGAPQYNAPQTPTNPYLSQIANGMTTNLTNNLQRKILPGIGRGAVATGGYGGSRQGIAEGLAIGDTNTALANSLASLYGGAYNQDQSNALSRYGMDQGFYTAQRGQDLQQNNQGFNQYLTGLNTQLGMGQQLANVGQQEFNAPGSALQMYANLLNPFTGLNQSQTTPGGGGGAMGAIGGALTGAQLWAQIQKMLGG